MGLALGGGILVLLGCWGGREGREEGGKEGFLLLCWSCVGRRVVLDLLPLGGTRRMTDILGGL